MRIKSTIFLLLVFLWFNNFAQNIDSLEHKYNRENIARFGNAFKKGNEKLTFADLRNEFRQPSTGFDLYQAARRNKTSVDIFRIGSLLSSAALISFIVNRDRTGSYISLGSQFVFTLLSVPL